MNKKVIIVIAIFLATSASCIAQVSSEVYSQNKEANTCYQALDYIKSLAKPIGCLISPTPTSLPITAALLCFIPVIQIHGRRLENL